MPSRSKRQHRLFEAAEHDPAFAHESGIPQNVAREFVEADRDSDDWKKRDRVAKKAAEQGMSPEIYKALHGDG